MEEATCMSSEQCMEVSDAFGQEGGRSFVCSKSGTSGFFNGSCDSGFTGSGVGSGEGRRRSDGHGGGAIRSGEVISPGNKDMVLEASGLGGAWQCSCSSHGGDLHGCPGHVLEELDMNGRHSSDMEEGGAVGAVDDLKRDGVRTGGDIHGCSLGVPKDGSAADYDLDGQGCLVSAMVEATLHVMWMLCWERSRQEVLPANRVLASIFLGNLKGRVGQWLVAVG